MWVENGVCVLDVHVKDLAGTGGPVFCAARRR